MAKESAKRKQQEKGIQHTSKTLDAYKLEKKAKNRTQPIQYANVNQNVLQM